MKKYLLKVADIYAYCLMNNHFHLLVRIKDVSDIEEKHLQEKPYLGFSHFLNSYTQTINKAYNRKGSLFQEHLKRTRVTDEDYFTQLVAYIHLNPVKHGFTDSLEYPHSSYKAMISDKETLLRREEVLHYFGDIENFKYWHDFQKIRHKQILLLEKEDY
jgi:REP element-mobilizing transposase RayT